MNITEQWIERLYRTIMRAVGGAIPDDVPREINGGLVMFSAAGMAACKFLTEMFPRAEAHSMIDRWAKAAHESVDAHHNQRSQKETVQ